MGRYIIENPKTGMPYNIYPLIEILMNKLEEDPNYPLDEIMHELETLYKIKEQINSNENSLKNNPLNISLN